MSSHRAETAAPDNDFPFSELSLPVPPAAASEGVLLFAGGGEQLLLKVPGVVLKESARSIGGKRRLQVRFASEQTAMALWTFSNQMLDRCAALVHASLENWLGEGQMASRETIRDMFVPLMADATVRTLSSLTLSVILPDRGASVFCYNHERAPISNDFLLTGGNYAPKHVILLVQPKVTKSSPDDPLFRLELILLQCMVVPEPPPLPTPPLTRPLIDAPAVAPSSTSFTSPLSELPSLPSSSSFTSPLSELPSLSSSSFTSPLSDLPSSSFTSPPSSDFPFVGTIPSSELPPPPPFSFDIPATDNDKLPTTSLPYFDSLEDLQDEINSNIVQSEDSIMQKTLSSTDPLLFLPSSTTASDANASYLSCDKKRKLRETRRKCRDKMRELVALRCELLDLKKAYLAVSDAIVSSSSSSEDEGGDDDDDDDDDDDNHLLS